MAVQGQQTPAVSHSDGSSNYGGGLKYGTGMGSPDLYQYLVEHSYRPNQHLDALHEESMKQGRRGMCSPPDSIPLLQMMVKLTQAKKIVEVGVFTGYTALGMALMLPEGGVLHACDISAEYPAVGQPIWKAAGVADKISLHIGPATDTLADLLAAEGEGTFDMGFIDADKANYDSYYELILKLLRPGGVVLVDNVLWNGSVLKTTAVDADTRGIQAINDKIFKDDRVDICMLPVSDGVTIVRKK
ncbi:g11996 [Coccomyxa viridis]|uniref:G11996 protein n=1 Tax=Coccomyxa viridis TaxID=1274662 RepID=A0ABP1G9C4_9CHLO